MAKARLAEIDVEQRRAKIAASIYERGAYFAGDSLDVCIIDGDDMPTVFPDGACTCIAASHGVNCLCKLVADLVRSNYASLSVAPAVPDQLNDAVESSVEPVQPLKTANEIYQEETDKAVKQLEACLDFVKSGGMFYLFYM